MAHLLRLSFYRLEMKQQNMLLHTKINLEINFPYLFLSSPVPITETRLHVSKLVDLKSADRFLDL